MHIVVACIRGAVLSMMKGVIEGVKGQQRKMESISKIKDSWL